jgi:hypothetical protein
VLILSSFFYKYSLRACVGYVCYGGYGGGGGYGYYCGYGGYGGGGGGGGYGGYYKLKIEYLYILTIYSIYQHPSQ